MLRRPASRPRLDRADRAIVARRWARNAGGVRRACRVRCAVPPDQRGGVRQTWRGAGRRVDTACAMFVSSWGLDQGRGPTSSGVWSGRHAGRDSRLTSDLLRGLMVGIRRQQDERDHGGDQDQRRAGDKDQKPNTCHDAHRPRPLPAKTCHASWLMRTRPVVVHVPACPHAIATATSV
jgi:hypothetical protein